MRAAVFQGVRDLRVESIPDPVATVIDLVLRVKMCGICGSDLHSYTTGAFVKPGQVMGHEFCGEVVEAGHDVQGVRVGDRITAMPFVGCSACVACVRGEYHLCANMVGHVIAYGLPGAFAEYVRIPRATLGRNVFRLPDTISDVAGATVEPLAVAVHAVGMARPAIGARVVVIGAGLIGQCMIQVLKASGVGAIVVSEISATRAEMARRFGADAVVDPTAERFVAQVAEVVGAGRRGRGAAADIVFDCAGVPGAFAQALELVRPGGTLAITALYEEPVQFDPSRIVWREVRIVGTLGYREEFPSAIELLRSGQVRTEPLVTDRFSLDSIDDGFQRQLDKDQAMKVMIELA